MKVKNVLLTIIISFFITSSLYATDEKISEGKRITFWTFESGKVNFEISDGNSVLKAVNNTIENLFVEVYLKEPEGDKFAMLCHFQLGKANSQFRFGPVGDPVQVIEVTPALLHNGKFQSGNNLWVKIYPYGTHLMQKLSDVNKALTKQELLKASDGLIADTIITLK